MSISQESKEKASRKEKFKKYIEERKEAIIEEMLREMKRESI